MIVIYGPQGSGKTANATALKKHYRCDIVVDGWDGKEECRGAVLALTNKPPPYRVNARAIHINDALKAIR